MKRGFQIVVSLLAIVLLARPFDCFATARTPEAMKCCLKGQCAPSAKADDCCKNTSPATNHFIGSKTAGHWTPPIALATATNLVLLPTLSVSGWLDSVRHPAPPIGLTAPNLPLLI